MIKYSIIIPAHNEEISIKNVFTGLFDYMEKKMPGLFEIIIVNDGSTDNTGHILSGIKSESAKIISSPYCKGYGASLKAGAKNASGDYLIFFDADGQHNPEDLERLIENGKNYDMVVGSREKYNGPLWRQPGKKILNMIANYLVNFKIPDLNSGLRLVDKKLFEKFSHLYPNGFSLSTTITLAFLKEGYSVKYIPIKVNKREGVSTVRLIDGFKAINTALRMIMLFSPMKIFFPVSLVLLLMGIYSLIEDIMLLNITDSTIFLLIVSILIFFFGLMADQISAVRREMNK